MRIIRLVKTCSAIGAHAWYEAEHHGQIYRIRKPAGQQFAEDMVPVAPAVVPLNAPISIRLPWWRRLIYWLLGIKKLCFTTKSREKRY